MNELKIFENEKLGKVRAVIIGEEIFPVGEDVARILEYKDINKALAEDIFEEDIKEVECNTVDGIQRLKVLNDMGVWSLLQCCPMAHDKADEIEGWLLGEVIPPTQEAYPDTDIENAETEELDTEYAFSTWFANTAREVFHNSKSDNKSVYVILMENNTVKIGITVDIEKRYSRIKSSSGMNILKEYHTPKIQYASRYESFLHRKFKEVRKNGEFFEVDFDVAVAELINKMDSQKECEAKQE